MPGAELPRRALIPAEKSSEILTNKQYTSIISLTDRQALQARDQLQSVAAKTAAEL